MDTDTAIQPDLEENNCLSDSIDEAEGEQEAFETDPKRLIARQKQIDFGKNTIGYENYLKAVPREKRRRFGKNHDPPTPDVTKKMSKKTWDGIVKAWRRHLHKFDNAMLEAASSYTKEAGEMITKQEEGIASPPDAMRNSAIRSNISDGVSCKGHRKRGSGRSRQHQQQRTRQTSGSSVSDRLDESSGMLRLDQHRDSTKPTVQLETPLPVINEEQQHECSRARYSSAAAPVHMSSACMRKEEEQQQRNKDNCGRAAAGYRNASMPVIKEEEQHDYSRGRHNSRSVEGQETVKPCRTLDAGHSRHHQQSSSRVQRRQKDNLRGKWEWDRPYGWDRRHKHDRCSDRQPADDSTVTKSSADGRDPDHQIRDSRDDRSERRERNRGDSKQGSDMSTLQRQHKYQHQSHRQRPKSASAAIVAAKQEDCGDVVMSDSDVYNLSSRSKGCQVTPAKRSSSQAVQQLDMRPLKL